MVTTHRAIVSHISSGLLRNFEYKEHNFSLRLHGVDVLTAQQEVSMCCRTKVVGGFPPDACMENGLCANTAGAAPTFSPEEEEEGENHGYRGRRSGGAGQGRGCGYDSTAGKLWTSRGVEFEAGAASFFHALGVACWKWRAK
ncbi:hypothetical protein V500_00721 [Pseudogymnoascus sp. VKM F-4518 (FW-2643)]|nr:hypothetical protein V500_00721 [Pseudogymnoascus sp. VKM F-4518 (FW-2643)]